MSRSTSSFSSPVLMTTSSSFTIGAICAPVSSSSPCFPGSSAVSSAAVGATDGVAFSSTPLTSFSSTTAAISGPLLWKKIPKNQPQQEFNTKRHKIGEKIEGKNRGQRERARERQRGKRSRATTEEHHKSRALPYPAKLALTLLSKT